MKHTRSTVAMLLCVILMLCAMPFAQAEELQTCRVFVITWGDPPVDGEMVFDAINEKLVADGMDFQLQLNYINYEVWEAKLNMMLSSGESFDAFIGMQDMIPWSTYQSRGAILPVTQYVEEYGQHLKEMIPESCFEAMSIGGELWGIPAYGSAIASNSEWITIRKDLAELYYDGKVPQTYEELLEYVQAVHEGCGAQAWPKIVNDGGSYLHRSYETYPFTIYNEAIYVDQEGKAQAWIDTEEFKRDAEFWYTCVSNGWTNTDILTLDASNASEALHSTEGASLHSAITLMATDQLEEQAPGAELDVIMLKPELGYFNSTGINHCWMVPVTAEHPELAVRFFDWLYSSQENHDLMLYGIEGVHWNEDAATITYGDVTKNCISYVRDEAGNTRYSMDFWMMGNVNYQRFSNNTNPAMMNCNMHILYGDRPEMEGVALGFVFDTTNVVTEWVNVQAEIAASLYPVKYGIVSYEEGYEDMRARFTAAGIDKVVAEYQRQLDAFLGK